MRSPTPSASRSEEEANSGASPPRGGEAPLFASARKASAYFEHEVDAETGLVRDNTVEDARATIAGSGFTLCNYVIAAERGYLTREDAAERVRRALRFLWNAPQGDGKDAIGTHGFFYHFLDIRSGRRMWRCEVSTIDSTILFAGALVAATYFDRATATEHEIRWTADALYRRADWHWALNCGKLVSLGWRPERGFLPYHWVGYNEALLLYVLALGSPTHPIPSECYAEWCKGYRWRSLYGYEVLYAGPLFIHQLSHAWIDFRGISDAYMRSRSSDYFENSRRATYVQRAYATRNPRRFVGYDAECWGFTACHGPGPAVRSINGGDRRLWHYRARGAPFGPDDGTVSPSAIAASLPFAPEIVVPTTDAMRERHPSIDGKYGLACGFNPSVRAEGNGDAGCWVSPVYYAIDQGLMVMMLENARSELIWGLMRTCPYVVDGLRRAGFAGGWL